MKLPVSDLKSFWGVLGCACWAVVIWAALPSRRSPQWGDAVLSWPGTWFAARIGVTSAYVLGELTKLSDFPATVAEQEQFGLNPGWLWASLAILVELGGSALVNSGYLVWLGVGLGVTTAIATLVANRFWAVSSHTRLHAANTFFEHIGLIVGLVLVPDCGRSESHQLAPAWARLRTMSDRWSSDFVTLGARKMRVINALALATLLLATAGGFTDGSRISRLAGDDCRRCCRPAVRYRACLCRARGRGPLQR